MKKRVAVVDILGGFGNQLFQLAFANDLKNKGFSVYVNLFNLRRVEKERDSIITNRNLILPLLLPFKVGNPLPSTKYFLELCTTPNFVVSTSTVSLKYGILNFSPT
ncbi:hypothetical protein EB155_12735, partial [archaeon]|nr:hypothetical protein [archaeon]